MDGNDILFNIHKKNSSGDLPPKVAEIKRRAESTMVYCRLIIDGDQVAETEKKKINWPSFEVDLLD